MSFSGYLKVGSRSPIEMIHPNRIIIAVTPTFGFLCLQRDAMKMQLGKQNNNNNNNNNKKGQQQKGSNTMTTP
jgi:hypothetical protein